jgi:hypothetical protein
MELAAAGVFVTGEGAHMAVTKERRAMQRWKVTLLRANYSTIVEAPDADAAMHKVLDDPEEMALAAAADVVQIRLAQTQYEDGMRYRGEE